MPNLYLNSDNIVEVENLTNALTGELVTTATVNVTLTDLNGNEVSGATFPALLTHAGSGTYQGLLPNTLSLSTRKQYKALYTADAGTDKHRQWCVVYDVVCQ